MDIHRFETQMATILKAHKPLQYHNKMMTCEIAAAADGLLPAFISSTNKILEPLQLPVLIWEQSYGQEAALGIHVVAVNCQSLSLFLTAFCSLLKQQQHGDFLIIDELIDTFITMQPRSLLEMSSTISCDEDTAYAYH